MQQLILQMFGHIQANLSVSITVKAMNHFRNFIISPSKIMSDDHLFYVICCDIPFSHFCTSNSDKLKIDIGQNYLQIILTEKRRILAIKGEVTIKGEEKSYHLIFIELYPTLILRKGKKRKNMEIRKRRKTKAQAKK